jgi:hypothetical protein
LNKAKRQNLNIAHVSFDNHHKNEHDDHDHEVVENFDYKHLLTANLNLTDKINEGGSLFFDCPPMDFNKLNKDDSGKSYFKIVDKQNPLKLVKANSPRVVVGTHTHYGKDGKPDVHTTVKEITEPNTIKRNFSPYWDILTKTVNVNEKSYTN